MFENTNKALSRAAFIGWAVFFAQIYAIGEEANSQTLFKKAETDGYSNEWDTIKIEAGPFNNTRQFNVRRISDPSKPNWNKYEGQWKAKFEEFPREPHLANWKGEVLSVWQSVDGATYFLLDIVKELEGKLSWHFIRSDRIKRTPAYFPEAILEEAVSEVLGIDPSRLTKKLLSDRLVSFELNGAEVRDLTGLSDAKNLEVLTLRDNLITDLAPLSGLPKLRRLELRGNRVESLKSLTSLPALVELNLSQNRLDDLSGVETLTFLRKLDVSENGLRNLTGVSKLKNLEVLHAQGNKLGVPEPFEDQNKNDSFDPGEKYEDLNGNGKWDNDPLPELDELLLLRDLYLYGNHLKDLSRMGNLPALRTLLLGDNEISDVSPLNKYASMRNLSLNRNQVADFGSFADLNSLVYLDLSENRLSDVRPLRTMKWLRTLLLNDNNLSDLRPLAGHSSLESLSFRSNLVTDLRPLAGLQNLRNLNAGRNLIDLESDGNAPVEQAFSRNKVRAKTAGQEKMVSGLRELGKALIGDKAANSELGAYLEENGYARLRDYHGDKQVSATEKTASYRKWTKAIRNSKIAELPRLNER